ncbi:MAG: 30S ribosomal protein S8 [Spirochaetota bacterium]
MSVSDPLADMLTKIRNASRAGLEKVDIPSSKVKMEIVRILKSEGYIKNYKKINDENKVSIRIFLKYDEKEKSVLQGIERVSKPGRRVYLGYRDMPRVLNGYGTLILSTSAGIITGKKATLSKVGGEPLCRVW